MKPIRKPKTPVLYIKESVYAKMKELVAQCPQEIGWHGFIEKRDDSTYILYDIILFPQFVSGVTVTPDEDEYAAWIDRQMQHDNFNQMRFHGHSHVNMPTNPSGIDLNYQQSLIANMRNDDYYFFMIMNKAGKYNLDMYCMADNLIYSQDEIKIVVGDPDMQKRAAEWAERVISLNVKQEVPKCSTISRAESFSTPKKSTRRSTSSAAARSEDLLPKDWSDWD